MTVAPGGNEALVVEVVVVDGDRAQVAVGSPMVLVEV